VAAAVSLALDSHYVRTGSAIVWDNRAETELSYATRD